MRSSHNIANASDRRNPESGYALLLIFSMAAILAIMLYRAAPYASFEAQRDKEQLLIDRGQEYSRAIALYVRKFNKFPGSIEDLENTNNMRFLRSRFPDPMTGKADWRILHAGPGGVIIDSILNGAKGASGSISSVNNFITVLGPMTGSVTPGDSAGINLATRLRPSDQQGAPGTIGGDAGGGGGSDPNASPTNSGIPGYSGPVMVLPNGTIVPANSTGTAPANFNPGAPGATGTAGTLGMPLVPNNGSLPTGVAIQQNTQNGQPGSLAPPLQGGPPTSAANMINQILTSPRPGGLNGLQSGPPGVNTAGGLTTAGSPGTNSATTPPQQTVIGAGIAGVASKREQEGIKEYNAHKKYNEWEFVYDVTKDPSKVGQTGAPGAPGASGAQSPPGAPGQAPATSVVPAASGTGPTAAPPSTTGQ